MVKINVCLSDIPGIKVEEKKLSQDGPIKQNPYDEKYYLELVLNTRKEVSRNGDTHTLALSQTAEQRKENKPTYVGSGKEFVFNR